MKALPHKNDCAIVCSRRQFITHSILGVFGLALFGCGGGSSRSAPPPAVESFSLLETADTPPESIETNDAVYAVTSLVTDVNAIPFLTADQQIIEFAYAST